MIIIIFIAYNLW